MFDRSAQTWSDVCRGGFTLRRASIASCSYPLAFLLLVVGYAVTGVANRIESVDGYLYAGSAEFLSILDVHDPRSLLFHKINQFLVAMNRATGSLIDTYALLCVPVILSAAGAVVLMHRFLRRDAALPSYASLAGAALLAVSYGFWRYANEIEVYIPSIFLILVVLTMLCAQLRSVRCSQTDVIPAGLIAGLGVLYYQANAIPLLLAMPVLFLSYRKPAQFFAYGSAAAFILCLGYGAAYLVDTKATVSFDGFLSFMTRRSAEFPAPEFSLLSIARGASALGRDIVSLNWLYGPQFGQEWIAKLAPAHAYYHEGYSYAASRSAVPVLISAATFAAAVVALIVLLGCVVRGGHARVINRPAVQPYLLTWLVLHSIIVLQLDPMEMEVWIVALAPLWALVAILIGRSTIDRAVVLAAVASLGLHNFVGGLAVFRSSGGDLYRQQITGILRVAQPGDYVLFTGPYPPIVKPLRLLVEDFANRERSLDRHGAFITPLYSDGDTAVIYRFDEHAMSEVKLETLLNDLRARGARLLVTEETLHPRSLPDKLGGEERHRQLTALGKRLGTTAQQVFDGPVGGAYLVKP